MKILKGRNCSMPSMQQRKVKPLEGVVYLPKSGNIVAVKLASSLYKLSLQTRETQDIPKDWKMDLSCQSSRREEERTVGTIEVFLFSQ